MKVLHPVPLLFREVRDPAFGLLGYLAIDRFIDGKSCGGIRWGPQVSAEETRALAYDMSLKFGFTHIRLGGAKAGIVAPFDLPPNERRARLLAFGKQLAPLLRTKAYIPGADLGTDHSDALSVLEGAGIFPKDRLHGEQAGYYTACGVVRAALELLPHLGIPVKDCRVAIAGFGKVGGAVGALLDQRGARVVAISTRHGGLYHPQGLDVKRLLSLRESCGSSWTDRYEGAERLALESLYTLPLDLLIPCAGPWVINESNVNQIQAKAVVPGANIPAATPIQERLQKRGIWYLPDFMCNCGGVLANTLEWRGFGPSEIERFFDQELAAKIGSVIKESLETGMRPAVVSERAALENLERINSLSKQNKGRSKFSRAWRAFLHPRRAINYFASVYYRKRYPFGKFFASLAYEEARQDFLRCINPDGGHLKNPLTGNLGSSQCV